MPLTAIARVPKPVGAALVIGDTNSTLAEAIAMYRAAGYHDIPDYNGNPYAAFWGEKRLDQT